MIKEFEIDYFKRTTSLEKISPCTSINFTRNRTQIENIREIFKLQQKRNQYCIDKRYVLINLIKIVGQDWYYYSEIEYIPEYRAYEVFNQI